MFEDIGENKLEVYDFELKDLEVSEDVKLLFLLNAKQTLRDLLDYNLETFKKDYGDYYEEILEAFKKKGYTLSDFWYHNGKRMSLLDLNNTIYDL